MMMLQMRTWMFVPGHSVKMVSKALTLDLDAAMLDLEDGVVPALKAEARPIIAGALRQAGAPRPARYVRMNGMQTCEAAPDLDAIVGPGLEGLVVPKVESVEEVRELASILDRLERERGV